MRSLLSLKLACIASVVIGFPVSVQSHPVSVKQTQSATETVRVTAVRLDTTGTELRVILETPRGQLLPTQPQNQGNTLIVDIPNAVLSLPSQEAFRAENPVE